MNTQHPEMYAQLWARVEQLLDDGKWHDYDQTISELSKLIPPSVAIRKSEQNRRQAGGPARRVHARDAELEIATGRRTIARVFLKNRRFESDMNGGRQDRPRRRIRLRGTVRDRPDGCPLDPRGHEDALVHGPRGAPYFVCNTCGRRQRLSQHPPRSD